MKIIGKKSISSIIKIFLILLFISCIIAMITLPILIKTICSGTEISNVKDIILEAAFMYMAAIPSLLMIIEFEKIFNDFTKEIVFSRKIESRLKRSSIYCFIMGCIFVINSIVYNCIFGRTIFNEPFRIMYVIVMILIAMIFLILSIGLMILRNVYRTAVDNKEENDLTI